MKATKGPWHTGAGNGTGCIFADGGRMRWESGGTTLYPIATVVTGWNEEEDEANGALLAVAPELLASLGKLTDWMLEHTGPADGSKEMLIEAVTLMAKARGTA